MYFMYTTRAVGHQHAAVTKYTDTHIHDRNPTKR